MSGELLDKVMCGLRCHSNVYIQDEEERDCTNCKYDPHNCGLEVPADALNLLKAKIPISPKRRTNNRGICNTYCGSCGASFPILEKTIKYCPNCGREVKWG